MVYVLKTGGGTYWKDGDGSYLDFRVKFSQATRFDKSELAERRAHELRKAEKHKSNKSAGRVRRPQQFTVESVLF